jgi:hypothetical protein
MTTTHTPAPTSTDQPQTTRGQRVELARYSTDTGQDRRLIGQRIDGIVHIFDEPTTDGQPSYLVEQGLTTNSELHALIDDYVAKAGQLGYPPMHGWF